MNGDISNHSGDMGYEIEAEQFGAVLEGPGAKKDKDKNLIQLTLEQAEMVSKARKYASEQNAKSALFKQNMAQQQHQQMISLKSNVQRQQALALMCRIYVGSISFELREDTVKAAFAPFGPIKSISMSYDTITLKHKGFAFVEFETPEAAQLAVEQMNLVLMGGRNIKVGRPSNMPQAQPIIQQIKEEAKQFNRVYVSSIHPDLTDEDIRSVFEAFGAIKYCRLAPLLLTPNKHKGYGYVEYETKQSCEDAIASMNLFDLGGQYLRVGRAVTPPNPLHLPNQSSPEAGAGWANLSPAIPSSALSKIQAVVQLVNTQQSASSILTTPPPPTSSNTPSMGANTLHNFAQSPAITPETGSSFGVKTTARVPPPGLIIPQSIPGLTKPSTNIPTSLILSADGSIINPLVEDDPERKKAHEAYNKEVEAYEAASGGKDHQSLNADEDVSISGRKARHMVMQKLMKKTESRVLVLKNMVGPEDIDNALEEEVTEECGKYGKVTRVVIYQERVDETDLESEIMVKIFVVFNEPSGALNAKASLDGRYFGGRTVVAEIYDQRAFDENDLSG